MAAWNLPTIIFSVLLLCISRCYCQDDADVCYEYLPCFSQKDPWVSAIRPFPPPADPTEVNTTLMFYSRDQKQGQFLEIYPNITLNKIKGFDPKKKTVFITHGFASSGYQDWVIDMKEKMLSNINGNVFLVNWEQGAAGVNYLQAAANTRTAGAVLGRFGRFLVTKKKLSRKNIHLIGHSLGSHISAYAAQTINNGSAKGDKVGQLTGLDCAQPGFEGAPPKVRVSPDKALFVETVHSDAKPFIPSSGFGFLTALGHVDFYLNSGSQQPGCQDKDKALNISSIEQLQDIAVEVISAAVACSHGRAYEVYTSSIDKSVPCEFIGHRTKSKAPPIVSDQSSCGSKGVDCLKMGLGTPKANKKGSFQVMTSGKKPYCCYNYSTLTGCSDSPDGGTVVG